MSTAKKRPYILTLIDQGEGQQLDFKFGITDARKIARAMAAFANSDGGKLLVGVKDNGIVAGVRGEEEIYMIQSAAEYYCIPKILFHVRSWESGGKQVLEITINPAVQRPVWVKEADGRNRAWVRSGDQNIEADSVQLEVWKKEKDRGGVFLSFSQKEKLLMEFLNDTQFITKEEYCRIALISTYQAEEILVNLVLLGILKIIPETGATKFGITGKFSLQDYLHRINS